MSPRFFSSEETKYKQFHEREIILISKCNFETFYHMMYPQYIYPQSPIQWKFRNRNNLAILHIVPRNVSRYYKKISKNLLPVFQAGGISLA